MDPNPFWESVGDVLARALDAAELLAGQAESAYEKLAQNCALARLVSIEYRIHGNASTETTDCCPSP